MSLNLLVFNKEAAPQSRAEFMIWFDELTEYTEGHSYDDPSVTTPALRAWLEEYSQTFPDMNGPYATGDLKKHYETDYRIGKQFVYVGGFGLSVANEAFDLAISLAKKYQVGFFDPQGGDDDILLPENGELKPIELVYPQNHKPKEPWWKWWVS
jgi:hypothetical protein